MRGMRMFVLGVVTGLTAAAISKELEKPPETRTWQGTIAGVPYNFRLWEWRGIAREYWNPDSDAVFVPHGFGVGWGVNFAALSRWAQSTLLAPPPARVAEQKRQELTT